MEYPEPFMAIQHLRADAHSLKVVDNISFNAFQPGLCCLQTVGIDTEGKILGFHQTVVAPGKLILKHFSIFLADTVELIAPGRDGDALRKRFPGSSQIHKGKLELHGTVKVIEEVAPTIKNLLLIFIAGELIVDVTELNSFCVMRIAHPADAVRAHTQIRDAVLGGDFFLIRSFRS